MQVLLSTSGKEIPGSIAARQPAKHKRSKLGFYDLMKSAFVVLETLMPAWGELWKTSYTCARCSAQSRWASWN